MITVSNCDACMLHEKYFCVQKRKERGRVEIESVHSVEISHLDQLEENGGGLPPGPSFPFQVGYSESEDDYVLYLLAQKDKDRAEWISTLRKGA